MKFENSGKLLEFFLWQMYWIAPKLYGHFHFLNTLITSIQIMKSLWIIKINSKLSCDSQSRFPNTFDAIWRWDKISTVHNTNDYHSVNIRLLSRHNNLLHNMNKRYGKNSPEIYHILIYYYQWASDTIQNYRLSCISIRCHENGIYQ